MSIIFTAEQQHAYRMLENFRKTDDPDDRTLVIHGPAGTGKSTLLSSVARNTDTEHLATLTGKAASVLRAKGCANAQTIHSLFYLLKNKVTKEDGKVDLYFERKKLDGSLAGHIIYLDECSMVSTGVALDLLRSGARIVAVGDPCQLPPVNAEQYFEYADVELHTVHRQALESPIIRQAHSIRKSCHYEADGDGFRVQGVVSLADMAGADVVLCFMRRTADRLNASIRNERGFTMPYPMAGEKLLCLKNAAKFGLYNGAIYTLLESFPDKKGIMVLEVDGKTMRVPQVAFSAKTDKVPVPEDCKSMFSYSNAMTVHKAQGSEWDKVVLIDECRQPAIRQRWLYTAATRAAKSIIIQK